MEYPQAIVSIVMLCICILLGVPVWWNTTKVYRASLPHHRIVELEASSIKLKIKVNLFLQDQLNIESSTLEKLFSDLKNFHFKFEVSKLSVTGQMDAKHCSLIEKDPSTNKLSYNILVLNNDISSKDLWYYCKSGSSFLISLKDEKVDTLQDNIKRLFYTVLPLNDVTSLGVRGRQVKQSDVSRSLPLSAGYNLVFTLALADPSDYLLTWGIEEAVALYLKPMLDKLDFLGPFHISSQILYFADAGVTPNKDENGTLYYPKSKLPLLINPMEARLNTYTSTDTGLNFIVYVPPKKHTPLYIKRKKSDTTLSTAFHSARWGGIQIYNSFNNDTHVQNMDQIMANFLLQFQMLNGISSIGHVEYFSKNTFELLPEWTRVKLLVLKTFEHSKTSISTLSSLSKLLDEIANIVIRDEIKNLIDTSVENIEQSVEYTADGNIHSAFKHSKKAFVCSEKAFYDSSLLALLYFPDDQKYAIYVPLFLPISLPIFLSFHKAVVWLRNPT